jgi:hypothetical protein
MAATDVVQYPCEKSKAQSLVSREAHTELSRFMDLDAGLFLFRDLLQVISAIFGDIFEVTVREMSIVDRISSMSSMENECLDTSVTGWGRHHLLVPRAVVVEFRVTHLT